MDKFALREVAGPEVGMVRPDALDDIGRRSRTRGFGKDPDATHTYRLSSSQLPERAENGPRDIQTWD